ncbi:hypothetical protein ASD11_05780 [Aeromicrobium sp. Root495]|uniref:hypothetical protein n=1 Tax=Aeromicrobium sp. Root495 TaxID=1736550 RepID=UPI0006FAB771|nr:hypothetical protein [Aeromicrobium sp. Root495]KQY59106.1 hypothetical protein ASD11_05780 [Aeromicrobium sp. Root495]
MTPRRTALGLLTTLTLLGGLLASPADAAAKKTSISVHVQNVKGRALKDVTIYAYQGKKTVKVGTTNVRGNLRKASGVSGRLGGGSWTLYLQDDNLTRYRATTSYAPKTLYVKLRSGKNLDLTTRTLATGAHILASVTTPSGLPVKGAAVRTQWTTDPADVIEEGNTLADGTLHFFGIPTLTLYLRARIGKVYTSAQKIRVARPGARYAVAWKREVPCRTTFDASPGEKPGSVVITASTAADAYGVPVPGGGVAGIYRDGEEMDIRTAKFSKGNVSLTLDEQDPGEHTYFLAYYSGDCRSWISAKKTVVVEPPPA